MNLSLSAGQRNRVGIYRNHNVEVFVLDSNETVATILVMYADHPNMMKRIAINRAGRKCGEFTYRLVHDPVEAVA